jgi:hypothetical protein
MFQGIPSGGAYVFGMDPTGTRFSFKASVSKALTDGTEMASIGPKGMTPAKLASDPGAPEEGSFYYNNTGKYWAGWNGTEWKRFDNLV